jgi:outer membrane protein OmpA-like peptidoglycan-associated protein
MKKFILLFIFINASALLAQEANFKIKNVSSNTKYSDFGVSYYGNNEVVFASTRKDRSIRKRVWVVNRQPYLELYQGNIENGDITEVKVFSKKLNSKFHDADVAFTNDLKTIYFSRNNYLRKKFVKDSAGVNLIQLYKATIGEGGKWTNITPMPFNDDNYQTGHPALNKDNTKLYFVSDMPGGYGSTDIYEVDINPDGTYGEPKNLGPNINTPKKEMFPYVDEDNILYFSSNGLEENKGGLDIYATPLNSFSEEKPINLGFPINSNKDDFAITFANDKKAGFFSSNRNGGKGDDDIYSFVQKKPLIFKCTQQFSGVVRDKNTGALLSDALVTLLKDNVVKEKVIVGSDARFNFGGDCNSSYEIKGVKQNFLSDSTKFISNADIDNLPNLDLQLKPSEFIRLRGKLMINIKPIYFDLDKFDIRKDAAIELERVVEIMNKYPEIVVQIASHTDSRARDEYNWVLSNKRAISTMNWLIDHGIDKRRVFGNGYGETQLVNRCSNGVKCSEAEHQKNRRTEFVIINPGVINQ